jgi:hypothetical protein
VVFVSGWATVVMVKTILAPLTVNG